ncbi:MAG TPA: MarR family transcriptional regulator, partial [Dehalococcoidia bacterium]|nr:MarR family transcriptional regulator [Dehalococcoidia bacterium]
GKRKTEEIRQKAELAVRLHEEVYGLSAWTVFWNEAVAERLGLNATDHKCLDLILKAKAINSDESMTPSELAKVTRLTTGAVTGVLDRLERAGFIAREHDPEDRRRIIIRPTLERIKEEVAPISTWIHEAFAEQCTRYSEDELRLLIGFAQDCQALMRSATEQLRTLDSPQPAV